MLGRNEDLIYMLFLFWGPGLLLVACIPGLVRTVMGFVTAIAFLYVWQRFMPLDWIEIPLAAIIVLVGFIGRKLPKTGDPEPSKLLVIPFMLLFTSVAWMAMGPIWRARMELRALPSLQSASVDGHPIGDLPGFQRALRDSASCDVSRQQLSPPVPLVLEAEGQRHEYKLVYSRNPLGVILTQPDSDRQLVYSGELLRHIKRSGIKTPQQ